jgi:hypothetical protein
MSNSTPPTSRVHEAKAELYANLARFGICRVVITYDGCNDNDCIQSIETFGPDGIAMRLPDEQVTFSCTTTVWNSSHKRRETRTRSLREAVETWCYDLLEQHFYGWENEDGASGTIELNVELQTGCWQHSENYVATTTHEMEV